MAACHTPLPLRQTRLPLCCCILILLVHRHEIVHVRLSLSELHFIHTFPYVPVQECLTTEHSCEVLSYTLEHFLDGGGISCECNSHLESLWWDITNTGFDIVGDPLNKV